MTNEGTLRFLHFEQWLQLLHVGFLLLSEHTIFSSCTFSENNSRSFITEVCTDSFREIVKNIRILLYVQNVYETNLNILITGIIFQHHYRVPYYKGLQTFEIRCSSVLFDELTQSVQLGPILENMKKRNANYWLFSWVWINSRPCLME